MDPQIRIQLRVEGKGKLVSVTNCHNIVLHGGENPGIIGNRGHVRRPDEGHGNGSEPGYRCFCVEAAKQLCIGEVGDSLNDGSGALCRIAGFENTGAYEYPFGAKLHHQSCIGRSCNAAGGEVYNGKFPFSWTYRTRS